MRQNSDWKVHYHQTAFSCPWFLIEKYDYEHLGERGSYYVHETPPGVTAILLHENKIVLMRQYYFPVDETSLHFPAGAANKGESPEDAVRRELREETGFIAKKADYLGEFARDPGYSAARQNVFLLTDAVKGQADEDHELVLLTPKELWEAIGRGELRCGVCLSAAMLLLRRLGFEKFSSTSK